MLAGGTINVAQSGTSAGLASGTLVNGGVVNVSAGGMVSAASVGAGGQVHVSSGGADRGTTIGFLGSETVFAGGIASGLTVSGGFEYLSGGTAIGNRIMSGGFDSTLVFSRRSERKVLPTNLIDHTFCGVPSSMMKTMP